MMKADQKVAVGLQEESGSTGTVGLITLEESKRVLYVAHVGDSLAYLLDDNTCLKLTNEHRGTSPEEKKRVE
jgi:serine/threonine protein phosphatase PrpC